MLIFKLVLRQPPEIAARVGLVDIKQFSQELCDRQVSVMLRYSSITR
jgi:hypothetical protein